MWRNITHKYRLLFYGESSKFLVGGIEARDRITVVEYVVAFHDLNAPYWFPRVRGHLRRLLRSYGYVAAIGFLQSRCCRYCSASPLARIIAFVSRVDHWNSQIRNNLGTIFQRPWYSAMHVNIYSKSRKRTRKSVSFFVERLIGSPPYFSPVQTPFGILYLPPSSFLLLLDSFLIFRQYSCAIPIFMNIHIEDFHLIGYGRGKG